MNRYNIRTNINNRARESGIDDIINQFINQTLNEIQMPGWSYSDKNRREHQHLWNFNKRKTTFSTVASQEEYSLPRDVDKIALIRQTTSPNKLVQIPDKNFYRAIPNPTATGNPIVYRTWEEIGSYAELSTDDKISIISDSTSDVTSYYVSITGYTSTDGIRTSEQLTLNGTTQVNGTVTFKEGTRLLISKSSVTNGTITIKEFTSGDTLLTLGPQDQSPRFNVVGLYPIPSSAITMYLEYFTRIRPLFNDYDCPDMPEQFHWVVEEGALSKTYEYKQEKDLMLVSKNLYASGVRSMIEYDTVDYDLIPKLRSTANDRIIAGIAEISDGVYVPIS